MTQERFQLEDAVLAHYLPRNMFRFRDMNTSSPYLQAGVVTNDGKCFVLNIRLSGFPTSKPKVYVEEMLRTNQVRLWIAQAHQTILSPHGTAGHNFATTTMLHGPMMYRCGRFT